jgi:asparagine N-glycosylation enzyme membrane subunit Stt3
MPRLKSPRRWSPIVWVVLAGAVLNVTAVWWGLPNGISWAPDEVAPSRVFDGLTLLFSHGWSDKYPPFHFYALGLVLLPFVALDHWKIVDFSRFEAAAWIVIAFRLLTVIMAAGLVYLVYRCGRELIGRRAGLWAAIITSVLTPFPYYAKTANLDVPYLFWFVWSLYFFIRLAKTRRNRYYLLFALTAVLSIATKDQAAGLFVFSPIAILWADVSALKSASPGIAVWRRLPFSSYLKAVGVAVAAFLVGFNILFNFSGFVAHAKVIFGPATETYQVLPGSAAGYGRLLTMTIFNIRFCLGWPFFVICLAGLALAVVRRPRPRTLLLLLTFGIAYLIFFIGLSRISFDRYVLPVAILLALFGGLAIDEALKTRYRSAAAVAAAAALGTALLTVLAVDVLMVKDARYDVERWLRSNLGPGASVGAATPWEYLPRLDGFQTVQLDLSLGAFENGPKPEIVIFAEKYRLNQPEGSPEREFFARFAEVPPGYKLVLKQQTRLGWSPLRFKENLSNLETINPEIRVYRRRQSP